MATQFSVTSSGAEVVQKGKSSAAPMSLERPRQIDARTLETITPNSMIYQDGPEISSAANETNASSIASATNVVTQVVIVASPVTIFDGAAAAIDGASAQSVTFTGSAGTLILDDALAFTGQVSGLAGSDAIDLADVSYGANTQATFLGNATGGTLTITNGTQTANIALVGDYLSSNWDLSSDGNGGTVVVDPVASNNWETLPIGAGGFVIGIDIAPDDTMVVRTDTYGAYIWNGTEWQQLVTSTSMPAAFASENSIVANVGNEGVYEI